ncbi:MAG: WD40 repeat domain-containing protein [Polyangia bacterium]
MPKVPCSTLKLIVVAVSLTACRQPEFRPPSYDPIALLPPGATLPERTERTVDESSRALLMRIGVDPSTMEFSVEAGAEIVAAFGPAGMQHAADVTALALSGNGSVLASADSGGTIELWDPTNGQRRRPALLLPGEPRTSLGLTRDGSLLMVDGSGPSQPTRVFDTTSGKLRVAVNGQLERILSSALSADGNWLALSGIGHGGPRLWQIGSGENPQLLDSETYPRPSALAFSPDGRQLAVARSSGIELWSLSPHRPRATLNVDLDALRVLLSFSEDGKLLAASGDKDVHIFQVDPLKELAPPLHHASSSIVSLAWAPGGEHLATVEQSGALRLWSTTTRALVHTYATSDATSVVFGRDSRTLFSGHESGEVLKWQLDGKQPIRAQGEPRQFLHWLSLDGRLAMFNSKEGITLWRVGKDAPVLQRAPPGTLHAVQQSADSRILGAGARWDARRCREECRTSLWIWDAQKQREIRSIPLRPGRPGPVAFSPDGQLVAVAIGQRSSFTQDQTRPPTSGPESGAFIPASNQGSPSGTTAPPEVAVYLWQVTTGRFVGRIKLAVESVFDLAFSPDGKQLAIAVSFPWEDGPQLRIWDVASWKQRLEFRSHGMYLGNLTFSPDGRYLASGSSSYLEIWDLAAGSLARRIEIHSEARIRSLQFSSGGRHLLVVEGNTLNQGSRLKVWRLPREAGPTINWTWQGLRESGFTLMTTTGGDPLDQARWASEDRVVVSTHLGRVYTLKYPLEPAGK